MAAIRVASEIESRSNSSWIVSDIESFDSNLKWDVIVMIGSVYYVNIEKIVNVLNRATGRLDSGGNLLLRIHNFSKHHHYIGAIDSSVREWTIVVRPLDSSSKTLYQ